MQIRNVQVLHNFFTILLYNSALFSGQPKLKLDRYAIRLTCPADNSEKNKHRSLVFGIRWSKCPLCIRLRQRHKFYHQASFLNNNYCEVAKFDINEFPIQYNWKEYPCTKSANMKNFTYKGGLVVKFAGLTITHEGHCDCFGCHDCSQTVLSY